MSSPTASEQPTRAANRRGRWQHITLWTVFGVIVAVGVILAATHGAAVPAILYGTTR